MSIAILNQRPISSDANGNGIVAIFAEEKRPRKREKWIVHQHKNIVYTETQQTVELAGLNQLVPDTAEPEPFRRSS